MKKAVRALRPRRSRSSHGRPVGDDVGAGERLLHCQADGRELDEPFLHAPGGVLDIGQRLNNVQHTVIVGDAYVRERTAGVDRDPEAHQPTAASVPTSVHAARTMSSTLVNAASSSFMLAGNGRSGIVTRATRNGAASAATATTSAA